MVSLCQMIMMSDGKAGSSGLLEVFLQKSVERGPGTKISEQTHRQVGSQDIKCDIKTKISRMCTTLWKSRSSHFKSARFHRPCLKLGRFFLLWSRSKQREKQTDATKHTSIIFLLHGLDWKIKVTLERTPKYLKYFSSFLSNYHKICIK